MMKKYVLISLIAILITIGLIISFLKGGFDVVKNEAVSSFNDLLITGLKKDKVASSWVITLPDDTTKLVLENDKNIGISIILDINPFLKAGLDVNKLPSYMTYDLDKGELYITSIYENKNKNDEVAIEDIYNDIVNNYRDKLGYHSVLGHFGLSLGDNNAFEYAKDINENDKDIVIALNPNVFQKSSVDVQKLEGYKYTDVTMDNGKSVKKLLKVFNIEEVNQCLITNQSC
jgi:hypothetical protein